MTWDGEDRRKGGRDLEALITQAVEIGGRKVAEEVVRQTVPAVVDETLKTIGINTENKIKVQEQMQYLRDAAARANDPEVAKDRSFLRINRLRCERVHEGLFDTATSFLIKWGLIVAVAGALIWLGVDFDVLAKLKE